MNKTKRKWDLLSTPERESTKKAIITFFKEQRNEELGIIAANELLDFFLQEIGQQIEKNTMAKSKEWLKEKLQTIEIDYDLLIA